MPLSCEPFVWRLVSIDLDEASLYQVISKRGTSQPNSR